MTDYLPIPLWLNKSFLEKSLRSYNNCNLINVDSFSIEPATAKGDNFASALYRIKLVYSKQSEKTQSLNCIVKVPYESGFGRDLLDPLKVYDKELEMYETILPRINANFLKVQIHENLFAITIYVSFQYKAIVFEDLLLKNFKMPVRSNGLDKTHAKMLLRKLAVFHAGCSHLCSKDRDVFKNFKHGMINRANSAFENFYLTSLDTMTELVATWKGFEVISEKLIQLKPKFMERATLAFDVKKNQFNTLIHGDIWVNNSMFRYDSENQPEDMMLVDFQFCCWSSPTIDLHYFFNTSLREELRLYHQDELIQYYHGELVAALNKMQFQGYIPTLHEFHIQFLQNNFYAFISSCLVQPIMINECTDDADVAAIHGTDERALKYKRTMYKNPKVQRNLRELLPIFDKKGLLD